MMRSPFSRLIGVLYIFGAIFGLIISVGGSILLWTSKESVSGQVLDSIALIGRTMDATRDTLQVVNASLVEASTNLDTIRGIIADVALTLEDSSALIQSTSDLVGVDMVRVLEDTQGSLESVESSSRFIDDFLRVIGRIPLIGSRYAPSVPLQQSVAEVTKSLEPLPESFGRIRRQLDVSAANVGTIQYEVEAMASRIDGIDASILSAREVAEEYRMILADLRSRWDVVEEKAPSVLNTFYLGLTAVLVWIFITQLAMLAHGIILVS